MKMKIAESAVKEYGLSDKEGLLAKAQDRFVELTQLEIDDSTNKKDIPALQK